VLVPGGLWLQARGSRPAGERRVGSCVGIGVGVGIGIYDVVCIAFFDAFVLCRVSHVRLID
jgi:hypothetical protein